MKKIAFLLTILFTGSAALAQNAFSVGTDLSVLRSFNRNQQFTAVGQTVHGALHLKPRESVYASISYFTGGKFRNTLTALAYNPATTPQRLEYESRSTVRYRNLSFGLKHYFKGSYSNDSTWNLYGSAGFGLVFGEAENSHGRSIDTARYEIPPKAIAGTGEFKRLTLDLTLGVETQIGAGFYIYGEARTWLRASEFPSPYLFNKKAPNVGILSGGLRILID